MFFLFFYLVFNLEKMNIFFFGIEKILNIMEKKEEKK
jgi:hypothetical protein